MSAIESAILAKLVDGPRYVRSFQVVKPVVDRMIKTGVLCRVSPPGSRARNMVALPAHAPQTAARSREDSMAELVSTGVSVSEAGAYLGLTKGQSARTWANIKAGLGPQAC